MVARTAEISPAEGSMRKLIVAVGASLFVMVSFSPCEGAGKTAPRFQAPAQKTKGIEVTVSDLFATKDWKSTQVRVLGFRLGMSREDANENAHKHDFVLLVPDLRNLANCGRNICEVCNSGGICPGITLLFDKEERVESIEITRTPRDAALAVRKAAITRKFKGSTYEFFNEYSENLREKLLGPGVLIRREIQSPPKVPLLDVSYRYPKRGLEIHASIDESLSTTPVDIDLSVSLVLPIDSQP